MPADNTLRLPAPELAETEHANPARGQDHAEPAVHMVKDAHQHQVPKTFTTFILQERDSKSKETSNLKTKIKRLQTL